MKKEVNHMTFTERGIIYIHREYTDKEEAVEDGYMYMFTSKVAGGDIYGVTLDNKGLRHECVLVKENKDGKE